MTPNYKFDGLQSFGPLSIYHFTRGLSLNIVGQKAHLRGGPKFNEKYDLPEGDDDGFLNREEYFAICKNVEDKVGVKVVACGDKFLAWQSESKENPDLQMADAKAFKVEHAFPPTETIFPVKNGYISDGDLVNNLISNSIGIEYLLHLLAFKHKQNSTEFPLDFSALNASAYIRDEILSTHIGPSDLDYVINEYRKLGLPIDQAFFVHNIYKLMGDIQTSFSRACYHFANMSKIIWEINQENDITASHWNSLSHWSDNKGGEICQLSGKSDLVTIEFTGALIACYSSLDFLYQMFMFLVRDPIINPSIPKKHHFPVDPPAETLRYLRLNDLAASDAPFAIPYLDSDKFTSLRKLRNDLVHNLVPGDNGTRIYIGAKLSPVNYQDLQYALYLTRDINHNGNPVEHDWFKSFYQQRTDGQLLLHQWLFDTWNCIFDTYSWLKNRLYCQTQEENLNPDD